MSDHKPTLSVVQDLSDKNKIWLAAVESNTRGLEAISSGFCAGCDDCEATFELSDDYDPDDIDTWPEVEASFSWTSCDTCGSSLGGDREPGHGLLPHPDAPPSHPLRDAELVHLEMCVDCIMYFANGDLPHD